MDRWSPGGIVGPLTEWASKAFRDRTLTLHGRPTELGERGLARVDAELDARARAGERLDPAAWLANEPHSTANVEAIPANLWQWASTSPAQWQGFDPQMTYADVAQGHGFEGVRALASEAAMGVLEPGPGQIGQTIAALPFLSAARRASPRFAAQLHSIGNAGGVHAPEELVRLVRASPGLRVTDQVGNFTSLETPRGATIDITVRAHPDYGLVMNVEDLRSPQGTPPGTNLGHMLAITDVADAAGATMTNTPMGSGRYATTELYRIYARLGFEPMDRYSASMVRRPLPLDPKQRATEAARRVAVTDEWLLHNPGDAHFGRDLDPSQARATLEIQRLASEGPPPGMDPDRFDSAVTGLQWAQPSDVMATMSAMHEGRSPSQVVLHMMTMGDISPDEAQDIMELVGYLFDAGRF